MNNIVTKKSKPKKRKSLKILKAPKQYRSSYRLTYDELYNLTDAELTWYINNGHPEERDMARKIRDKKKMDRLVTFGY